MDDRLTLRRRNAWRRLCAAGSAPKGTLLGIQTSPGSIPSPGPSYGRKVSIKTQIEGEQSPGGRELASGQPCASSPRWRLGSTRIEGAHRDSLTQSGQSGHRELPRLRARLRASPQAIPKRGGPKGRTMLGVPVVFEYDRAGSRQDAARGSVPLRATGSSDAYASATALEHSAQLQRRRSQSTRTRSVVILASMALLTIIAMVYLRLSGGASDADVSARITTGPDGETLLFEVPDAREGSSIRFGGQEQPPVAGRATFALASDSLRVGENVVLADVVAPDGETSSARIVLSVFYRIWVDSSNLRVDKPSVDVIVNAVPGTKVTLEGQDVPLDNQGRASKTYPVDIKRQVKAV